MQATTQNRFKVLGVNDDTDFCECCGKQGLQKVVWIEDSETGDVQHFGVVCARNPKKAFGLKSEISKAEYQWQGQQEIMWSRAQRIYKQKGGKWVSNGIPLHLKGGGHIPVDAPLWESSIKEAKTA